MCSCSFDPIADATAVAGLLMAVVGLWHKKKLPT
jgi:hypothetical protein